MISFAFEFLENANSMLSFFELNDFLFAKSEFIEGLQKKQN